MQPTAFVLIGGFGDNLPLISSNPVMSGLAGLLTEDPVLSDIPQHYFTHLRWQAVLEFLKQHDGKVAVFAHSYGCDTLITRIVPYLKKYDLEIDLCVTLDPVGKWLRNELPTIDRGRVKTWFNFYAEPAQLDKSDLAVLMSGLTGGGAWKHLRVADFNYEVKCSHREIGEMLTTAVLDSNHSMIEWLREWDGVSEVLEQGAAR